MSISLGLIFGMLRYLTWLVCKLRNKISKNQIFRNVISRHANFKKSCRIINIDITNYPWKYHIDILKIDYFTVKWRQMLVSKTQNGLQNAN